MQLELSCVVNARPAPNPQTEDFRYVFVANNRLVRGTIFASPQQLLRFNYFLVNTSGKDMLASIVHIIVADPEFKTGFTVDGYIPTMKDSRAIDITLPSGRTLSVVPKMIEVPRTATKDNPQTTSSSLSFSLDTPEFKKNAIGMIIMDEYEKVIEGNRVLARSTGRRLVITYAIELVEDGSKITKGGPYVNNVGTHTVVVEGRFTSWALANVANALTGLANAIQKNLPMLNNVMDAEIKEVHLVTAKNTKGEKVAKAVFIVNEKSPIGAIGVILSVLGGLALIFGIVFTIGQIRQVGIQEKSVELTEKYLAWINTQTEEKNNMINKILENPNLTSDQKRELIDSVSRSFDEMMKNVGASTTLLPSTQETSWLPGLPGLPSLPGLPGGEKLSDILMWGGVIAIAIAGIAGFVYFAEREEMRRRLLRPIAYI